jgi:hypothetical protein
MPGEVLLVGIATIAVAVAGFTAVTSTLEPPGGSWSPAMRLRQRAIVSTSFNVAFEALAPLIAFAWLGDERSAFIVASYVVAIYTTAIVLWRGRQFVRAGGMRTGAAGLMLFAAGPLATLLFWANAIVFASLAIFALALLVQLSVAMVSFYSLVSAASGEA